MLVISSIETRRRHCQLNSSTPSHKALTIPIRDTNEAIKVGASLKKRLL